MYFWISKVKNLFTLQFTYSCSENIFIHTFQSLKIQFAMWFTHSWREDGRVYVLPSFKNQLLYCLPTAGGWQMYSYQLYVKQLDFSYVYPQLERGWMYSWLCEVKKNTILLMFTSGWLEDGCIHDFPRLKKIVCSSLPQLERDGMYSCIFVVKKHDSAHVYPQLERGGCIHVFQG